jgi:hypothetical protein
MHSSNLLARAKHFLIESCLGTPRSPFSEVSTITEVLRMQIDSETDYNIDFENSWNFIWIKGK